MAHFAEIDLNNIVLRVNKACDIDIANNGGEQSEQAAEHFATVSPLSENGVKWVQTSYNHNFRKQYAGIGFIYDANKDKFITPQPFASWSLDSNDDWQAPVAYPTIIKDGDIDYNIYWNESNLKWYAVDRNNVNSSLFEWDSVSLSWVKI
jgi:hypothetical protein